jgi:hypothetical protein
MPISQNVLFYEDKAYNASEIEQRSEAIAKLLQAGLEKLGWHTFDIDVWRGNGWSIPCSRNDAKLDVVFVKTMREREWMLQVSPWYRPLFIGWLLRRKASASPSHVLYLANDIHAVLQQQGCFSGFQWCWDGFPDGDTASPEPIAPK